MPRVTIEKCLNCEIKHSWLFAGMDLQDLRAIKQLTGMRAAEYSEASENMDPDAIAALLFVLHRKDGITIPFEDINVDFNDMTVEPTEEEIAAEEAAKKELEAKAAMMAAKASAPSVARKPSSPKSGAKKTAA